VAVIAAAGHVPHSKATHATNGTEIAQASAINKAGASMTTILIT
jgi:hypothetical protein